MDERLADLGKDHAVEGVAPDGLAAYQPVEEGASRARVGLNGAFAPRLAVPTGTLAHMREPGVDIGGVNLAHQGREATRRRYGLRQDVAYLRRQGVTSQRRQDVTRNRGRMSLHAFLHIEKPPPCLPYRRLVVPRRLVIGLHRDGLYTRAGDGTRTRDSLLGKQELYP